MKTDYSEISIYMQIIRVAYKASKRKPILVDHGSSQFTMHHPIDYNEKACIFDSQNKAIKMLAR